MAHQKLVIPAILKFEITPCIWSAEPSGRLKWQPQTAFRSAFLDPWQEREAFLRLDKNRDEILKFLNRTGQFYGGSTDIHPVSFNAVTEWRNLARKLMIESDFRKWKDLLAGFAVEKADGVFLESQFYMRFDWATNPPEILMSERTTLGAMLATIHLDHARNVIYKFCARPSCRAPFEPQSKHKQTYCGRDCAHAHSQSKVRLRRRSQELQSL